MASPYFTLVSRVGNRWGIEFGDYSLSVVRQERVDSYEHDVTRILTTPDDQASIDKAVDRLNGHADNQRDYLRSTL